jgi:hypothetical protein
LKKIAQKTTKEKSSRIDANIIMTLEFSAPNLNVNGKMIEFIYGMVSGASALEFEKNSTEGWLVVIAYAVIGIVREKQ